jgi:hypothetical protein
MVVAIIPCTVDVRLSVDIYPDDPRPWIDDTELEVATVVAIIPCTVDVKLSVDIYPDDPKPFIEDIEFAGVTKEVPRIP